MAISKKSKPMYTHPMVGTFTSEDAAYRAFTKRTYTEKEAYNIIKTINRRLQSLENLVGTTSPLYKAMVSDLVINLPSAAITRAADREGFKKQLPQGAIRVKYSEGREILTQPPGKASLGMFKALKKPTAQKLVNAAKKTLKEETKGKAGKKGVITKQMVQERAKALGELGEYINNNLGELYTRAKNSKNAREALDILYKSKKSYEELMEVKKKIEMAKKRANPTTTLTAYNTYYAQTHGLEEA